MSHEKETSTAETPETTYSPEPTHTAQETASKTTKTGKVSLYKGRKPH